MIPERLQLNGLNCDVFNINLNALKIIYIAIFVKNIIKDFIQWHINT